MKISVIIPVYNQAQYLKEAIESIIQSNFKDLEVIVVNDGSTDESEKVAKDYSNRFSWIKCFSQENSGLSSARNLGLTYSSGEILHFLDSDDFVLGNCYEIISKKFKNNSDIDLLISGYSYFKDGVYIHTHQFIEKEIDNFQFLRSNIAPPVSFFIKKALAIKINGFDLSLKSCEDWDFWIRATKMGAFIKSIPDVLVAYRYVQNSMSRNPKVMYKALTEVSKRAGKIDVRLPEDAPFNQEYELDYPEIQKNHLIRMLGVMLHQGKVEEAVEWYLFEKKKWNWKESDSDWKGLSTYLSWGYFFEKNQIDQLLSNTGKNLFEFFAFLGYPADRTQPLIKLIFEAQYKRRNHHRFGKIFGGFINKLGWY